MAWKFSDLPWRANTPTRLQLEERELVRLRALMEDHRTRYLIMCERVAEQERTIEAMQFSREAIDA